ncbi:MAG: hypothetical protein ACRC5C_14645 [Bacilli bacterium]
MNITTYLESVLNTYPKGTKDKGVRILLQREGYFLVYYQGALYEWFKIPGTSIGRIYELKEEDKSNKKTKIREDSS